MATSSQCSYVLETMMEHLRDFNVTTLYLGSYCYSCQDLSDSLSLLSLKASLSEDPSILNHLAQKLYKKDVPGIKIPIS